SCQRLVMRNSPRSWIRFFRTRFLDLSHPTGVRTGPARRGGLPERRSWPRLRVEELEPIVLPAAVPWTGASGDWGVGSNWSTGSTPTSGDDVFIQRGVTVTHSAGTDTVHSVTLGDGTHADNLTLSGGTLTVSGTVQNLGTGSLSISNNATL